MHYKIKIYFNKICITSKLVLLLNKHALNQQSLEYNLFSEANVTRSSRIWYLIYEIDNLVSDLRNR